MNTANLIQCFNSLDLLWRILGVIGSIIAIGGAITSFVKRDKIKKIFTKTKIEGIFTDPRDDKKYRTIKIGRQIWFAQNLEYNLKSKEESKEEFTGHYDWETAKIACPLGWHLPSREECEKLIKFLGGKENAGKKLIEDFKFLQKIPSNPNWTYCWWAASENDCSAFCIKLKRNNSIDIVSDNKNTASNFVRCIKD